MMWQTARGEEEERHDKGVGMFEHLLLTELIWSSSVAGK